MQDISRCEVNTMMRLAVAFCAVAVAVAQDLPPSCDSPIYCYGDIIRTVNLATPRLFNDSKSFVDLRLINSPNVTVDRFAVLTRQVRATLLLTYCHNVTVVYYTSGVSSMLHINGRINVNVPNFKFYKIFRKLVDVSLSSSLQLK